MEAKPKNDDHQVIVDDRGFYKIGNWWVKVRRINVREMIAAWGVISQAFVQVQGYEFDWKQSGTWIMLFLTALPTVPGKFFQFLMQVMELQNTSNGKDEEFFKKEYDKYAKYVRNDLKTEELVDVIKTIYNQEKDRFGELAKQINFFLQPLIDMMMAEKKKQAEQVKENLKTINSEITGLKPST